MRLSGWAPWCVPGPMVPLLLLVLLCGGCQIQSAPQCFRSSSSENVYLCEWNSSAQNHVIHFGKEKQFPVVGENCIMVREEKVFTSSEGEVWVEPEGRPSCASPKINITLAHTIRFDRPQRLSVRWSQDNLTLSWSAPEKTRAAVEIRHQEPSYQWRTHCTRHCAREKQHHGTFWNRGLVLRQSPVQTSVVQTTPELDGSQSD
uniref:Uncharacterized protein n=1 Tax=Knipowitschia caucasica TaxID=637954 RepID=A0AAV2KP35_KNICA